MFFLVLEIGTEEGRRFESSGIKTFNSSLLSECCATQTKMNKPVYLTFNTVGDKYFLRLARPSSLAIGVKSSCSFKTSANCLLYHSCVLLYQLRSKQLTYIIYSFSRAGNAFHLIITETGTEIQLLQLSA